ncbi:hypothetical protein I7I48_05859 [Histoplasma ohiense]|nr:hypothetical protein I7I48_05859 [Histoplasma ohiense (nom. inval.)]
MAEISRLMYMPLSNPSISLADVQYIGPLHIGYDGGKGSLTFEVEIGSTSISTKVSTKVSTCFIYF